MIKKVVFLILTVASTLTSLKSQENYQATNIVEVLSWNNSNAVVYFNEEVEQFGVWLPGDLSREYVYLKREKSVVDDIAVLLIEENNTCKSGIQAREVKIDSLESEIQTQNLISDIKDLKIENLEKDVLNEKNNTEIYKTKLKKRNRQLIVSSSGNIGLGALAVLLFRGLLNN